MGRPSEKNSRVEVEGYQGQSIPPVASFPYLLLPERILVAVGSLE